MDYITVNGVECTDEQYPSIRQTEEGPYCGRCNNGWRKAEKMPRIRHADSAAVRMCYAVATEMEADMYADYEAEMAVERHFEDRGYYEARAQDDYEARMGVVSFADAYAEAMR